MSNDEVYASGLLTRALDPVTQPPEIRAFMDAEYELLASVVGEGMSWLDVGCGIGRHLALYRDRVRLGVGIDYEQTYIEEAHRRAGSRPLYFVVGDAARLPFHGRFDIATCLTNTWGTMSDKQGVLDEMRRCASRRLLSVFAATSVPARREWYHRFGHPVIDESDEWLLTAGGLRSEHFTEARLHALVDDCEITHSANIGFIVQF